MSAQLELYKPKDQTSALALALAGHYGGAALSQAYLADEEAASEFDGLQPQVQRLKANAQAGTFGFGDRVATKITGVILARAVSQIHSAVDGERSARATAAGYPPELLGEKNWLCYNGEPQHKPKAAYLNPRLSELSLDACYDAKLGGATKQGCLSCPAHAWTQIGDVRQPPMCRTQEQWIWLDSALNEPLLLTIGAATSVAPIQKWLPTQFQQGRNRLWPFSKVIHLEWVTTTSGERTIKVLKPSVVGLVDPADFDRLKATRNAYLWMLPQARGLAEADEHHEELTAAIASAALPEPAAAEQFGAVVDESDNFEDVPF